MTRSQQNFTLRLLFAFILSCFTASLFAQSANLSLDQPAAQDSSGDDAETAGLPQRTRINWADFDTADNAVAIHPSGLIIEVHSSGATRFTLEIRSPTSPRIPDTPTTEAGLPSLSSITAMSSRCTAPTTTSATAPGSTSIVFVELAARKTRPSRAGSRERLRLYPNRSAADHSSAGRSVPIASHPEKILWPNLPSLQDQLQSVETSHFVGMCAAQRSPRGKASSEGKRRKTKLLDSMGRSIAPAKNHPAHTRLVYQSKHQAAESETEFLVMG